MQLSDREQSYYAAAESIANELMREAIWFDGCCTWIDISGDYSRAHPIVEARSMNPTVYNGLSGVLLFFTKLYKCKEDDIYLEYIQGIISATQLNYEQLENDWSYFMGKLGVLHTLWKACLQIKNQEGLDFVSEKLKALLENKGTSFVTELLYGVSGSIDPLIELMTYSGIDKEAVLEQIGIHILESAIKKDDALTWSTSISSYPLTGLSHGASGIALTLLKLFAQTGKEEYKETAGMALRFEDKYFDAQICNWKDLRNTGLSPGDGQEEYSMAWCNGAPGIGLARLGAWQILGEDQHKREALIAFDKTRDYVHQVITASASYVDFSLCHGLAGNAYILRKAGENFGRQDYLDITQEVAMLGLRNYHQPALRWPSGSRHPEDGSPLTSYSLLLGTSGVGWFYLSFVDDELELPNF